MFYTHGGTKVAPGSNVVDVLDDQEEDALKDAYRQTFDLVDSDKSGTLDKKELMEWMVMCGAELDVSTITDVLLKEGELSRAKFADLMCAQASSSRRDYDIGGSSGVSHH